jgi:opacity protein-like surface antigen
MVGFTSQVYAVDVRIEGGGGWAVGYVDAKGFDEGWGGGPSANAGIWIDKLFTDNLSLGLQYLYLSNTLSFSDVNDQHTRINAGMFNAAWRLNNGVVHPYVGAGIGFGVTNVSLPTEEDAPNEHDTATDVAGQVFFGFDYDILDNIYVGVNGRWFITDPELFGFDETVHQVALMGTIGYKF